MQESNQAIADDRSFIRAAELWLPEGETLKPGGGHYGNAGGFADVTARTAFAKGEGLPGKAWEQRRPLVLDRFDKSCFIRHEAAKTAGLTCAVALPIFADQVLKAILVVFCGGDADHVGAIEVWEERDGLLHLDDGYYGASTDFAQASKDVTFARGQGLPGGVWSARTPILMRDIGASQGFVRSDSAGRTGLKTGLGIPLPSPDGKVRVATFLSAPNTPLASRFEVWDAREERVGAQRRAVRIDGICEREGPLWPKLNPPTDIVAVNPWQGPIGQVLGTGLPHVVGNGVALPAGYRSMVAVPIYRGETLAFITAWYL